MDYNESFIELNKLVESLRTAIDNIGIDRTLLKTSSFEVNPEHVQKQKQYVFDGYRASHTLTIELPIDKDKLNQTLEAIVKSKSVYRFSIYFSVKNNTGYRDQVLSDAVVQSKHNADIIAKAAGVTLGAVASINYGWSEVVFTERYSEMDCATVSECNSAPDIEPSDINISETVTMVFEIN
jgi:uncharacterized protein YggE